MKAPVGRGADPGRESDVPSRRVERLTGPPQPARTWAAALARSAVAMVAARRPVHASDVPGVVLAAPAPAPGSASADRLTAYQHLVGEPASDRLPAGFLHVLTFPLQTTLMTRRDFGLPLLGLVHVSNHVEVLRPVLLGEPLEVRVWAEPLAAHRSGTAVDLRGEVRVGDEVVWDGTSRYLARGVRLASDDAVAPTDAATERTPFVAPVPTGRWVLPADLGRRYGAVSGDRNPIHLSPLAARAFGFPRAIAHGMWTAARALADVGPRVRGDAYRWGAEFATPVLLPSAPAVRVSPHDDGCSVTVWDPRRDRLHLTVEVTPRG